MFQTSWQKGNKVSIKFCFYATFILYFNKMNMIYLCSDAPKSMDIDKVKKEEKGVKKEKEEPKEG